MSNVSFALIDKQSGDKKRRVDLILRMLMIVLKVAVISSLGDTALMFEDIWMTCLVTIC